MGSKLPMGLVEWVTAEIEIFEPRPPAGWSLAGRLPATSGRLTSDWPGSGQPASGWPAEGRKKTNGNNRFQ